MTPEGKVKDKIKTYLAKCFPKAWSYMPVQTGYGAHGIPDHIYCLPIVVTEDMVGETVGVFLAIEAKTRQGKMSAYQSVQRDNIVKAEGIYLTIYGSEDIEDKLKRLKVLR